MRRAASSTRAFDSFFSIEGTSVEQLIADARTAIKEILHGSSNRLLRWETFVLSKQSPFA